jgi:hypothetical protein
VLRCGGGGGKAGVLASAALAFCPWPGERQEEAVAALDPRSGPSLTLQSRRMCPRIPQRWQMMSAREVRLGAWFIAPKSIGTAWDEYCRGLLLMLLM